MNANSLRSTTVCGSLAALAATALTACATIGGPVASGTATSHAARPLAAAPVGYIVCSGGHASRLPEQEKIGRVCRPSATLQAIY